MSDRIQIRRDTSTNWTSVNPILADGEIAFEKDTNKIKVGDGITAWTSLLYSSSSSGSNTVVITSGSSTALSAANTHYIYLIAGAHVITLPTAIGNTCTYSLKNNHTSAVTINTTSSQTIDGATSLQISPEDSVDIVSNATNWSII